MSDREEQEAAWECLAVRAQGLARDGRPEEGAHLLSQVPVGQGFSGYLHEAALAWIEIGRAYLSSGRREEVGPAISEAIRVIDQLDVGGRWEAGACRLALAELFAARGDELDASGLAVRVAKDSAPLQNQDIDCMKNLREAARVLASLGRIEEAREALRLLTNQAIRDEELERLSRRHDIAD